MTFQHFRRWLEHGDATKAIHGPEEKAAKEAAAKESARKSAADKAAETRRAKAAAIEEQKAPLPEIAQEYGVRPEHLQAAAEALADVKGEHVKAVNLAIDNVVARTGLTPQKIDEWEAQGGALGASEAMAALQARSKS